MNSNMLLKFNPKIHKKKSKKPDELKLNDLSKRNSKQGTLLKKRTIKIPPLLMKSHSDTDMKLAKTYLTSTTPNKSLSKDEIVEFHVDAYAGMYLVTIQDEIRFSDEKTIQNFELKIPENSSFSTVWNIIMTLVLAFYIIMFPMES